VILLQPTILARTSRLSHPPVLLRGSKQLVYGNGVAAPWNASTTPLAEAIPPTPIVGKLKEANGLLNGKVKESQAKATLPDARLYATWDYEQKSFKTPLAPPPRNRGRMGSIQGGSGVISLGLAGGRSGSKVG
jgi:Wiskott-Aldrich syndrome protein